MPCTCTHSISFWIFSEADPLSGGTSLTVYPRSLTLPNPKLWTTGDVATWLTLVRLDTYSPLFEKSKVRIPTFFFSEVLVADFGLNCPIFFFQLNGKMLCKVTNLPNIITAFQKDDPTLTDFEIDHIRDEISALQTTACASNAPNPSFGVQNTADGIPGSNVNLVWSNYNRFKSGLTKCLRWASRSKGGYEVVFGSNPSSPQVRELRF
jgi:hypothetical protein